MCRVDDEVLHHADVLVRKDVTVEDGLAVMAVSSSIQSSLPAVGLSPADAARRAVMPTATATEPVKICLRVRPFIR